MILGQKLGEGGEGVVYAVGTSEAAKVYHDVSDPERLRMKLNALVAARSDQLEDAAAWPQKVILAEGSDLPIGYVMQLVSDARPLYQLYQTRSRQKYFPKSDWAFLLRAARNLATCVHFVHEAGLIIGDLNESNILVAHDAMVRLIDVDSFQIVADGFVQTCDVGKGEMLPPELQGNSLSGLRRTAEQDRFALAVLIFQLLMLGRHPFAGRQLDKGEDHTIEEAIAAKWYAYATPPNGPLRPPPNLNLAWMPDEIREMFSCAFVGKPEDRPSAKAWFHLLEEIEARLHKCDVNERHTFPRDGACPWCRLERAWGTVLFVGELEVYPARGPNLCELAKTCREIVLDGSLVQPGNFSIDNASPGWLSWTPIVYFLGPIVNTIRRFNKGADWSSYAELTLILSLLGLFLYLIVFERRVRRILKKAKDSTCDQWPMDEGFEVVQGRVESTIAKYESSEIRHEQLRIKALRDQYGQSLHAFLAKYSVLGADVPTVGYARLEALHRLGTQNASQVVDRILRTNHWKQEHIDEMMAWRNSLELQFWATSSYRLTDWEEDLIRAQIVKETRQFEAELRAAPAMLAQLRDDINRRRNQMIDEFHRELQTRRKSKLFRNQFKRLCGYELPEVGPAERAIP